MPGPRILVVEQGTEDQLVVRRVLERLGATVEIAVDGPSAIAKAVVEDSGDAPYALVFLALDRPATEGTTGIDLVRTLRKRTFEGPVIAMSPRPSEPEEEECLAAGFDDYMPKPAAIETLVRVFRRYVRPAPRTSGVIPRLLVSEYADDAEMMEIVRPYVRDLPDRAAAIQHALDDGDLDIVRALAKQLKGSAGSYGFPQITAAAGAVDKAIVAGDEEGKVRARVEELSRLASIARSSMPPQSLRAASVPPASRSPRRLMYGA